MSHVRHAACSANFLETFYPKTAFLDSIAEAAVM
jgi:hypothetical protein